MDQSLRAEAVEHERAAPLVAVPLLEDVLVVAERRRAAAACMGVGTMRPACLRVSPRYSTSSASPATKPTRKPAMFDRFDSEWQREDPAVPLSSAVPGGVGSPVNSA